MRVRFADCQLDTESHELTRAGEPQRLTPKAFALLSLLVESRPRALSKAELHDRVWPDAFVGRSSLARLIHEIRAAVGDSAAEPRLLRTVGGVGYAFAGDAADVPQALAIGARGVRLVAGERPRGIGPRMHGAKIAAHVRLADGGEMEIGLVIVEVLAHRAPSLAKPDERAN